MKKCALLILSLGFVLAITPLLSSITDDLQQKKKRSQEEINKYIDEWLNSPIRYIITKKESKAFKKLKSKEERLRFINYFWLKRDPDPETNPNEFRDEFLKRAAYSNKYFQIGSKKGWKSHRGQILIVFGSPTDVQRGIHETSLNYEIWTYFNLPTKKLPQNYSITFIDKYGNQDYRVFHGDYFSKTDFSQEMDEKFYIADSYNLPPKIISAIKDVNKLSIVNKNLNLEDVPLPSSIQPQIPFKLQTNCFQSDESAVQFILGFSFRYADLYFKEKEGKMLSPSLDITTYLLDQDKAQVDSFKQKLIFSKDSQELEAKNNDLLFFWHSLQAEPGKYFLNIKVEDKRSGAKTLWGKDIDIPPLQGKELFISEIIPADEINRYPQKQHEAGSINTLWLMGHQITPNPDAVYHEGSKLCLFFQLINLQLDSQSSKPLTEISCYIFKEKKLFRSINLPRVSFTSRKPDEILASFCIPLIDFPVGDYILLIQAIDKIANKDVGRKLKFKVLEKTQ